MKQSGSLQYISLGQGVTYTTGARHAVIYRQDLGKSMWLARHSRQIVESALKQGPVEELFNSEDSLPTEGAETLQMLVSNGFLTLSENPHSTASLPENKETASRKEELDFLWFEITGRCNLKCLHCYGEAGGRGKDDLSTEEIEGIIRQSHEAGCRRIQLTGGEPLLREDLPRIIRLCRDLGFEFIEVYTNGTRLTDEMVSLFKKHEVQVAVSFYSWRPETHDRITAHQGSWKQTVRALEMLVQAEVPVRAGIVSLALNQGDLEETFDFLRRMGVTEELHADPVRPTGRGKENTLMPDEKCEMNEQFQWIQDMLPSGQGCGECGKNDGNCWRGKLAITCEGEVIPCIFARALVLGSVRDHPLSSLIASDRLQRIWGITLDEVEVCRDCEFRRFCSDCRALPYTATGDLYGKSPRCFYDPYHETTLRGPGSRDQGSGKMIDDNRSTKTEKEEGESTMEQCPKAREKVLRKELDGDIFLVHPDNGAMYGLNPTAAIVWEFCDGSYSSDQITDIICELFEVKKEIVKVDTEEILRSFQERNLLEHTDL